MEKTGWDVIDWKAGAIKFGLVEPGEPLQAIWPSVVTFLALALLHSHQHEWTAGELLSRINSGEFLLAVVIRDEEIIGAQVFDIGTNPRGGKYLAIVCSGGRDMAAWLPGMVALGKHLGELAGAESILVFGRRGWQRQLHGYGFKTKAVLLSVDVADLQAPALAEIISNYRG
jgi:hypothetical protein